MPDLFDSGFVVREPAWHGLAEVLETEPETAEEAILAAGLDWQVRKAPIFAEIPGDGSVHVDNRFATYRTDTNAVLGVVGKDWTPVQNRQAFSFLDEVVQGGDLRYATAGSLEGGAKVWLQVEWPQYLELAGGEKIRRYILVCNGHAGTLAFRLKNVHERVVCANTLGIALSERANSFTARHSSGIMDRSREARDVLGLVFKQDELFQAMANQLLETRMAPSDEQDFIKELIRNVGADDSRAARNATEARNAVLAIMRNGEDLANVRGTAWAALQAATEYADWHTRVKDAENRFKRNILKDDPLKVRALYLLAPTFAPAGAARVGRNIAAELV